MSIEVNNVQRLRLYVEPAGSFAVAHEGTLGDFSDVPFIEGTANAELMQDMLPANLAQQFLDGYALELLGKQSNKFTFQMFLAGTGVAANGSTSAVSGPLGTILKNVMGGETLAMGSAIATATSASQFDVTATQGSRFSAGVGIAVPINGAMHARELKTVATDTLSTKIALPSTPSVAAVVYRAATYYLTENPDTSFQVVLEGAEADDRWVLRGMQVTSIRFELQPGQTPKVTFEMTGTTWANLGAGSLAVASYLNTVAYAIQDSQLLVQTVGTNTYSGAEIHASTIEFNPNLAFVPVTSPGGSETVYRWRRGRSAPVLSGEWVSPYEDTSWFSARDNRTTKHVAYQIGNSVPTANLGTMLITVPRAQITDVQRVADGNGLAGQKVAFKAGLDSDATDQTTELRRSAFRVHLW
jgi:hypothetical protein